MARSAGDFTAVATCADEACFWLYSVGIDRRAEGHGAHPFAVSKRPPSSMGSPCWASTNRTSRFRRPKLFFAYGFGNGLTVSAVGRRDDDPDGRTAHTGCGLQAAPAAPPDILLWRPDDVCRDARVTRPPGARRAERCAAAFRPARRCPRSSATPLERPLRRRYPRRHRFDRDAAYLPLQPPGDVRYGTTGKPVPAIDIKLDRRCRQVRSPPANIGDALDRAVRSAREGLAGTSARRSRNTFQGWWTRSGDKYIESTPTATTCTRGAATTC